MPTRQERMNYSIAQSHASSPNGQLPMKNAQGETLVTCMFCDGTGLPQNTTFRNIEFCKNCNGKGYVTVAQPKKPKFDYELPSKKISNKAAS